MSPEVDTTRSLTKFNRIGKRQTTFFSHVNSNEKRELGIDCDYGNYRKKKQQGKTSIKGIEWTVTCQGEGRVKDPLKATTDQDARKDIIVNAREMDT